MILLHLLLNEKLAHFFIEPYTKFTDYHIIILLHFYMVLSFVQTL